MENHAMTRFWARIVWKIVHVSNAKRSTWSISKKAHLRDQCWWHWKREKYGISHRKKRREAHLMAERNESTRWRKILNLKWKSQRRKKKRKIMRKNEDVECRLSSQSALSCDVRFSWSFKESFSLESGGISFARLPFKNTIEPRQKVS